MVILLLKSSACLAILMLFYKIVLEPLNHHHFKRFYLLAALLISAIIPFITFIKYVEPTFDFGVYDPESMTTPPYFPAESPTITEEQPNTFLPTLLWTVYAIGVIVFSTRFILNLFKISSKIKRHQKVKTNDFINVLIEKLAIPHTFFNYIFLNKSAFENDEIPQEVLLHEQTHAKQKHSLDILFLEILQIIFWFNPLLYFIKKDIKLNHEFLADQHVLKSGYHPKTYQNLLLSFSSNQKELALVNAINYMSIKKRLTIMNTQTSHRTKWLRSLLLLPVLALLLFSFSQTKEVEKEIEPKIKIKNKKGDKTKKDKYYQNATIRIIDTENNLIVKKSYSELTEQEKSLLLDPPSNYIKKPPTKNFINEIKNNKEYGVWIDGKKVNNNDLDNYKASDFSLYYTSKLAKNAKNYSNHYYQVNLYSNERFKQMVNNGIQPLEKKSVVTITQKTTTPTLEINQNPLSLKLNGKPTSLEKLRTDFVDLYDKKDVELQISSKGKSLDYSVLEKVTEKLEGLCKSIELSHGISINDKTYKVAPNKDHIFNVVKKKVATQDKQYPMLGFSVFKGEPIYANKKLIRASQVAVTTEKKVLNFKFKAPGKPTVKVDGTLLNEEAIKNLESANNGSHITYFDIKLEDDSKVPPMLVVITEKPNKKENELIPPPPPPIPQNATKEQKENYEKVTEEYYRKYKIVDGKPIKIPEPLKPKNLKKEPKPPAPPKPKSPLETVVEMAKKGATFYYNSEKISSKKVIELLKENMNLNISSNTINGVSTVHISDSAFKTLNSHSAYNISYSDQKHKETKIYTSNLTVNAENLEELTEFDWDTLKTIFKNNSPEDTIKLSFNYNKTIKFDQNIIDNFNFTISGKTIELESMIKKSKNMFSKLEEIH